MFLKSLNISQLPYNNVFKHYKQLFLRATNVAKKAGFTKRELEMGLFAICSWIDEIIICSNWSEKDKWLQNPFQLMLFKTTNAGEEFFIRLASLDNNDKNVRQVFDYCMALGFKGQYYNSKNSEKLNEIKRSNQKLISGNSHLKFPQTLFPEAYAWSSQHPYKKKKPWSTIGTFLITLIGIIIPVILFIVLFLAYKNVLFDMVFNYLKS